MSNMTRTPAIPILTAICLLSLAPGLSARARAEVPPQRIAVLDFHDSSTGRATPEEVLYLSDLVRGVARRVLPAERYLLMTRENIMEMLPQGRTLTDCVGDCAVETGRNLGADFVVTGEVTGFGGEIRVTVNLHGIQTGNLIDQIRAGAPNVLGVEKDLEDRVQSLLLKLRVPAPSDGATTTPSSAPAAGNPEPWSATGSTRVVVSFTSEPAGAIVEIDGQPVGETPCKRALATGVYRLGLKKVRYVAHEQTLDVRPGTPPTIAVALTPDFGWLTVESDPAGLSVTVDGEVWGLAPIQAREIGTGPHDVQVGSDNHYAESRSIAIERGERETVRVAPVPRNGGLTVIATDAQGNATDARVVVDGRAVGQTYQPLTLMQGWHQVTVEGEAGAWKGEVTVVEKEMRELTAQLAVLSIVVKLVEIPAGSFLMGSPTAEPSREDNELQHRVEITQAFQMSSTEVTQAQYELVAGSNPSKFKGADRSVEQVSWLDAVQFCNKLSAREGLSPAYRISDGGVTWDAKSNGYRLPTEAEWEYACRAGTTMAYHTGDGESDLARAGWYSGNAGNDTRSVGKKTSNAWGLYDMHGNVWEWCWDRYGEYGSGSQRDPQGAANGSGRVIRGGSWINDARYCRSAFRYRNDPSDANLNLGFRVVRSSAR
jgi:formylglycine-generating enzyme required for sulfatase activity